jgi:hypothetical protein
LNEVSATIVKQGNELQDIGDDTCNKDTSFWSWETPSTDRCFAASERGSCNATEVDVMDVVTAIACVAEVAAVVALVIPVIAVDASTSLGDGCNM